MHPDKALKYMPTVDVYRLRLAGLQGVWDTLSLLSHMGGDGTDLTKTRAAFESLAGELVQHLCAETFRKSSHGLSAKAQVAIDVLVRNLFERTADIGFLCADDDLREFFADPAQRAGRQSALRQRLREYVDKYSVYSDVILIAPDGRVLLRLMDDQRIERSADPLINETLRTQAGYVETYRRTDLVGGERAGLIYSYRVMHGGSALGVLCLCFDFAAEIASIFSKLRAAEDWTVLSWLDKRGRVIASSDPLQMPEGAVLPLALEESGRVIRFAGREYLAITRPTAGYQGYLGPGWYGHAMLPLEHAFEGGDDGARGTDEEILAALAESNEIFTDALRRVPERADVIQRELNRSVWNGNVRLVASETDNNTFAKALLREISVTGQKTKEVFARSIGDLHETVLSAILQESRFTASLAVEIMDRNLYERANDCRWWALNGTLRECLTGKADAAAAIAVLEDINRLYTVYHNLILFDRDCKIVAVSNPKERRLIGRKLQRPWANAALTLHNSQAWGVSAFEPSDLYGDRRTYVFTAAVRGQNSRVVGGIGIMFDSEPQFRAMLNDVLPRSAAGGDNENIALLLEANGNVISATSHYAPGETPQLPPALLAPPKEGLAQVLTLDGQFYVVGACRASGYREFPGMHVTALVMMPIGVARQAQSVAGLSERPVSIPAKGHRPIDMATFFCAGQWFAVPAADVVEAIDNANVTHMPGRGVGCTGIIKYRDQIVPLLNLGQVLRPDDAGRADSIVIVSGARQPMLGLQVQALGDVIEAPSDAILPMADILSSADGRLSARMVRPGGSGAPPFLLLDSSALAALMRPEPERLRA